MPPDGNLHLRNWPRQPESEQASSPKKVQSGLRERRDEAVALLGRVGPPAGGQRDLASTAVEQSAEGSAAKLAASINKAVGVRKLRDPDLRPLPARCCG